MEKIKRSKEILFMDENKILRAIDGHCTGSYDALVGENVMQNEYKQEIKEQIKYLRDYPRGTSHKNETVEISPLFTPSIIANYANTSKTKLNRSNWLIKKNEYTNPKLSVEIPHLTSPEIREEHLTAYIKQIDINIRDKIKKKQNSLIGKIKRGSIKNIDNFSELELELCRTHPRIEIHYKHSPGNNSGIWDPEVENWRLE